MPWHYYHISHACYISVLELSFLDCLVFCFVNILYKEKQRCFIITKPLKLATSRVNMCLYLQLIIMLIEGFNVYFSYICMSSFYKTKIYIRKLGNMISTLTQTFPCLFFIAGICCCTKDENFNDEEAYT